MTISVLLSGNGYRAAYKGSASDQNVCCLQCNSYEGWVIVLLNCFMVF